MYTIFFTVGYSIMVAQILIILYNVVDRFSYWTYSCYRDSGTGRVGVCFPLIILITGFTNMFGMGGTPLFSMAAGAGKKDMAQGYTEHLLCSPHYLCGSPYGDRRNMGWTDP